ncbi:hypothetical protein SISSUDRAFT_1050778 [Sistotremastrum suecicum HHB10207 ss-3]|uniref:Uncharacterized protein n=1 Tax=Sistotremastrum suecicum HHB10207 ss-3 TaxID=1314776 RepID=A0A166AZ79_9AGAM|nr:hypothetical protein SISSUDRAFT_1050778 [Sistotremastrum suecicum HHB10207 ss-3]
MAFSSYAPLSAFALFIIFIAITVPLPLALVGDVIVSYGDDPDVGGSAFETLKSHLETATNWVLARLHMVRPGNRSESVGRKPMAHYLSKIRSLLDQCRVPTRPR